MPRYRTIKLIADPSKLQGALEQLNRLAENNPSAMDEFYSLFTGVNEVCKVAASAVVGNELICHLTASDRFLEFLAERQKTRAAFMSVSESRESSIITP